MSQAAPPRNTDFDVSGSDGVRFVVVTSTFFTGSAQPAWQPFDTAAKRLADQSYRDYDGACRAAERLNERDRAEERAAACS